MEYYIYHIQGVKIGMTNELEKRMAAQGFTEWEILETHNDPWLCGDRELELQAEYGYPVDKCHYMVSIENRRLAGIAGGNAAKRSGQLKKAQIKGSPLGGKAKRSLTFEQAEEIRDMYKLGNITQKDIGLQYNVTKHVINDVVNYRRYLEP